MVAPATLSLELLVLFLAAATLAGAGILALLLLEPRGRDLRGSAPRTRAAPLLAELLAPPVAFTFGASALVAVILWARPVGVGSPAEVDLSLAAGALGGVLVAGFAATVSLFAPRPVTGRPIDLPMDRRPRRGWVVASALVAGSGGGALLVAAGMFLAVGGHVPGLLALLLGSGVASLSTRTVGWIRRELGPETPESLVRSRWVRGHAPALLQRSVDLYAVVLFAAIAAMLLAYIPSTVRLLQPNAVLFPLAALGVVWAAGLLALPIAVGDAVPSGPLGRVTRLGAAAFGGLGLLALVPPFLPGGRGLFLSGIEGLVAGTATFVIWEARVPGAGRRGPAIVRGIASAGILGSWAVIAYWVAGLTFPGPIDLADPGVGMYGVAIAAVAWTGLLGNFAALDLGGAIARSLSISGEPAEEPAIPEGEAPASGAQVATTLAAAISGLVLLTVLLSLPPLEAGVAPGSLVNAIGGADRGGAAVGAVLGLLVPSMAWWRGAGNASPRPNAPSPPRFSAGLGLLAALSLGLPPVAGGLFGAPGIVGTVLGVWLGTLALAVSPTVRRRGSFDGDPAPDLAPSLLLALTSAVMVASVLYAGAIPFRL